MTPDRRVVLHDFFNAPDGGGKVAKILAKSFDAELLTGHFEETAFPDGYFDGVTPKSLDAYSRSPGWLRFSKILQLCWAFAHVPATPASWAIFSGSLSPLAYKKIRGSKIYYCLTPPRLLYDQRRFLAQQVPVWQRPLLRCITFIYRVAYERAVRHMDVIVTISETVRARTMRYLGHDSLVVYPPCETDRFGWIQEGNFFLSTARVDSLKRVALIVETFLTMPEKRLVVVSGGSDLPKVKKMAERVDNIDILGWVDDETLRDLMGRCLATIYIPRDEDFGISPVESMAAGKPVIGVQEGALIETVGGATGLGDRMPEAGGELLVTDCGVLVPREPGAADMVKAVEWMTPARALRMRGACEVRAGQFDTGVFLKRMRELLGEGRIAV